MVSSSASVKTNEHKPERFRFFISYAREDYNIAIAISNAIQDATGASAEVFMDTALPFGVSFKEEIFKRLDDTNVLVVIHSEILKPAFSYPGLELGYFIRVMNGETRPDFPRRIVPIYLDKPPSAVAEEQGISIGITRATLKKSVEEFKSWTLEEIDDNHSAVELLRGLQDLIRNVREKQGAAIIRQTDDQRNLPALVVKMLVAIFSHLKTSLDPESTLKPQLQITLKTNDDALCMAADGQLPESARLLPVGTGSPMSIFGLPSVETTWLDFQQQTKQSKFRDSWVDAITKVVTFSIQNLLAKDNSQVIVSYDGRDVYRVILTTGLRYFNGDREFNIYFVELRRVEFGDPNTTLLFKGLDLFCRFRSLFLELNGHFSSRVCGLTTKPDAIKEFASGMERELNLLSRDALEAGLDNPQVWLGLVEPNILLKLSHAWQPLESKLREQLTRTRRSETGAVEGCQKSLILILSEMETVMRPLNAEVICEMAEKLKTVPSPADVSNVNSAASA